MKSIQETMGDIHFEFSIFDDPRDKYIQLIDLAKKATGLPPELRNEENKIIGCTSQAWIVGKKNPDNTYQFRTDSDAMIVKGLLSLIERILNGHTGEEIGQVDGNTLLDKIGLGGSISSQRMNGVASAITKIKTKLILP